MVISSMYPLIPHMHLDSFIISHPNASEKQTPVGRTHLPTNVNLFDIECFPIASRPQLHILSRPGYPR